MEESQVVAGWMTRGEERGLKMGLEQARRETRREDLLRVLRARFPGPLPEELLRAIQSESDGAKLSHWFDEALQCASLEQFESRLKAWGPFSSASRSPGGVSVGSCLVTFERP